VTVLDAAGNEASTTVFVFVEGDDDPNAPILQGALVIALVVACVVLLLWTMARRTQKDKGDTGMEDAPEDDDS
jgi:hypothetical protein